MLLLDRMIACERLEEFVDEFVMTYNKEQDKQAKEQEDKMIWEIWLHRIFDKSYPDFLESLGEQHRAAPTPEELKDIAMDSKGILAGFVPDEGMVSRSGTVQAAGNDSGQ